MPTIEIQRSAMDPWAPFAFADRSVAARGGRSALLCGVLALVAVTCTAPAHASSHREAPLITSTPKLDGTDFYMFRSYEPGRDGFVTFVANYQPLQDPYGGPNYFELDSKGIYEIKIDNDGDGVEDLAFQFRFKNDRENLTVNAGGVATAIPLVQLGQIGRGGNPNDIANLNVHESYSISVIRGGSRQVIRNADTGATQFEKPVDNIGFKTLPDYAAYAAAHVYNIQIPGCAALGRVFVGQRKDSFVISLGETFDLINYPHPIGEAFANSSRDDIADKNVTSLELELPISCLRTYDSVIGAWTTASRPRHEESRSRDDDGDRDSDDFVQVSRLGNALVNELVIGLKDKDAFNASEPKDDARFLHYVQNPSFPTIVGIVFGAAGVQAPNLFPRSDLIATFLTGIKGLNQPAHVQPAEMLRLNTNTPVTPAGSQNRLGAIGGDSAGYPNGRRPGDDIVDITLRVAMGRLITLGTFGFGKPAQAPSGGLDFTDGAIVNDSFFDNKFPYLKTPIAGSPGAVQPSVPLPANPVLPGLEPVSVQ
jgi:hypothetical protein